MHTQNNDNLPENNHHDQGLNIGRAIVAWLVAAVLAVTFAAFASFEAQAAPFGSMSLELTISRDSEFILLAVAAAAGEGRGRSRRPGRRRGAPGCS